MEAIINWIVSHADKAHLFIFIAILLAGFNIPISIDLLVIIGAILAATTVPENTWVIFSSIFIGACLSAWIAFWFGRILGSKLSGKKWFEKLMPESRIQKLRQFYEKHGFWTLLIGRFIPFGIRNCLFMTTGMSKFAFRRFAMRDLVACLIWSSISFYVFYTIGQNYQVIYNHFLTFSAGLVLLIALTVSFIVWRKKAKLKREL